jgi:hypothetical protein
VNAKESSSVKIPFSNSKISCFSTPGKSDNQKCAKRTKLSPALQKLDSFSTFSLARDSHAETTSGFDVDMSSQPIGAVQPNRSFNFDDMLCYMDATVVSAWLSRANENVEKLSSFCNATP